MNKRLIIGWTIWTVLWFGLHLFLYWMFDRHDILQAIFFVVVYVGGLLKVSLLVERLKR